MARASENGWTGSYPEGYLERPERPEKPEKPERPERWKLGEHLKRGFP
jgi:hypothetical protein